MRRFICSLITSAVCFCCTPSCSSDASKPDGSKQPEACTVTAPSECPSPAVTYSDVKPIFDGTCTSAGCHTGIGDAPWSLKDYQDVADWQELVRADILDCSMPPPESNLRITNEDRMKILTWVRCGALP